MSFIRYIAVLEALAMAPAGASTGVVARLCLQFTQSQVKRTLSDLVGEGLVREEKVQYRPHILSTVYHITEKAREHVGYVADKYDRTEHQKQMQWESRESIAKMADQPIDIFARGVLS